MLLVFGDADADAADTVHVDGVVTIEALMVLVFGIVDADTVHVNVVDVCYC